MKCCNDNEGCVLGERCPLMQDKVPPLNLNNWPFPTINNPLKPSEKPFKKSKKDYYLDEGEEALW